MEKNILLLATAASGCLLGMARSHAEDEAWKTRIPARLHIGTQAPVAADLEIACRDGKGGLGWSLIIAQSDAWTAFPLVDFEGPGGIGEKRVLAQWSVGEAKDGRARARRSRAGTASTAMASCWRRRSRWRSRLTSRSCRAR